ncbi:DUF2528 family protein [Alicycliphilus denitrificans]|uniref:DUF2528 family protein n=1 Tax=Alicycliphilus denitrificans TaxID=179636 RepID=UPI0001D9EDDF|nr:DUF2528 family protein [Alicycliphilus denitrificans]ADU99790.1 hypothetical protein Alide_2047 [Alicycliphilus denitrificans BC]
MSTSTTYRVAAVWFGDAEVTLQVDLDVLTPELAAEINGFWSGDDDRLRAEDGNVLLAVIRMFGQVAIRYLMADGGASFGPSDDPYWTEQIIRDQGEGWPDWQELGILVTAAEVSAVGYDDVTLEAVAV